MARRPHPLLLAVMGLLVGAVFAVLTYQYWNRDRGLTEHGRETSGTVVEVSGSGRGRTVVVEFEASGRTVRSKVEGRMETRATPGDTLPVRYDERRPERDVYDARITTQGRWVYLLAAATLVALVGAPTLAVVEARRRRPGARVAPRPEP